MIKKILPTMIGAALVGGMAPAVADVTVFGHIDTSIVYDDQNVSTTNMVCTTCSVGFKGSEDLGNGLKAIFSLDFQYDTTERNTGKASSKSQSVTITPSSTPIGTGLGLTTTTTIGPVVTSVSDTSSITDRDQWLGLAGNFGQVRFGTISTIYKSHGAMLDPIYRTVTQGRDIGLQSNLHRGAGEDGQGRATNTIRYDSPSWNGLKVGATYTLQNETQADNNSDSPYSVGVEYQNGPFLVMADYITNDNGGDDDAYKVGGKYTIGNYAVFGQYEVDGGLISNFEGTQGGTKGNSGDGADVWFLGGTGTFGNNTLYLAYGQGEKTTGNNSASVNNAYDTWNIVGVHSMSKRTWVYAGYAAVSPDESGVDDADLITLGMKHKF